MANCSLDSLFILYSYFLFPLWSSGECLDITIQTKCVIMKGTASCNHWSREEKGPSPVAPELHPPLFSLYSSVRRSRPLLAVARLSPPACSPLSQPTPAPWPLIGWKWIELIRLSKIFFFRWLTSMDFLLLAKKNWSTFKIFFCSFRIRIFINLVNSSDRYCPLI